MDVTKKHGTVVKVSPLDATSGKVTVEFDGVKLSVDPSKVPTSKNATILDEMVQFCIDVKAGKAQLSGNPYV